MALSLFGVLARVQPLIFRREEFTDARLVRHVRATLT